MPRCHFKYKGKYPCSMQKCTWHDTPYPTHGILSPLSAWCCVFNITQSGTEKRLIDHVFTLGRVLTISPAVTRVILSNHGLMLWTSGLCLALCAPVELIKRPANKKDCSVGVFSQCVRVYLREVACYGVVAPVRLSLNWGFLSGLDFNGTFPVKTILFYSLF